MNLYGEHIAQTPCPLATGGGSSRSSVSLALTLAAVLALVLATVVGTSGCGRKTPPRPLSSISPAPEAVMVRQVGPAFTLSWAEPPPGTSKRFGGIRGWLVRGEQVPAECLHCLPQQSFTLELTTNTPDIDLEGGRVYFTLPAVVDQEAWRFWVSHLFVAGEGPWSGMVQIRGLIQIPSTAVRLVQAQGESSTAAAGRPPRHLVWESPPEALVHVQASGTPPAMRELRYRANVYRRHSLDDWPRTALNSAPLRTSHWPLPPVTAAEATSATTADGDERWEYAVRLVNRFGAEGSLSIPVADLPNPVTDPPRETP